MNDEFKLKDCAQGYGHGGSWCGPSHKCWLDPRERRVREADFEDRKSKALADQANNLTIANLEERLKASEARCASLLCASQEMLRVAGIANQGSNAYNRAIINLHAVIEMSALTMGKCPDCGHDNVLCACGYKS